MIVGLTANVHEVACQMPRRIASNKAEVTGALGADSLFAVGGLLARASVIVTGCSWRTARV
jgi:hypothetical protein